MWRAASRVGCREREDIVAVKGDDVGFGGGRRGGVRVSMWVYRAEKVEKDGGGVGAAMIGFGVE